MFAADVAIVRQLLENFVEATKEARALLESEVKNLEEEGGEGRESVKMSWTLENAPRLFMPSGMLNFGVILFMVVLMIR